MNQNDQKFIAQRIRTQYMEKESTEIDALRALDIKVKRPANVFACIFGIIGALILGIGMCFAMDAIEAGTYFGITIGENMMISGIIIGLVGIFLVCINYPIYKGVLNSRKRNIQRRLLISAKKL